MRKYLLKYTRPTGYAGQGERVHYLDFEAETPELAKALATYFAKEKAIHGAFDILETTWLGRVEAEPLKNAA